MVETENAEQKADTIFIDKLKDLDKRLKAGEFDHDRWPVDIGFWERTYRKIVMRFYPKIAKFFNSIAQAMIRHRDWFRDRFIIVTIANDPMYSMPEYSDGLKDLIELAKPKGEYYSLFVPYGMVDPYHAIRVLKETDVTLLRMDREERLEMIKRIEMRNRKLR